MVRKSLWIWGVLFIWVFAMAGCAKPPAQEIEAAKAAVERTRRAEAEKYAPQEFSVLQDSLNAVLAEVDKQKARFALFRNYDRAKASALTVTDRADRVENTAIANKEKIRKETGERIAEAQAAVDNARSLLETTPVGKGTKADIEQFKADLSALQASLLDARNALSREDFSEAKAKAQTIQSKAEGLRAEIQTAVDKYRKWRRGRR